MNIPPRAFTVKLAIAAMPPISPLNEATPEPAFIVNPENPLIVDPNATLRLVVVMVVSDTNVTAPPKLMSPEVAMIEPPNELNPITEMEAADKVTLVASTTELNIAS